MDVRSCRSFYDTAAAHVWHIVTLRAADLTPLAKWHLSLREWQRVTFLPGLRPHQRARRRAITPCRKVVAAWGKLHSKAETASLPLGECSSLHSHRLIWLTNWQDTSSNQSTFFLKLDVRLKARFRFLRNVRFTRQITRDCIFVCLQSDCVDLCNYLMSLVFDKGNDYVCQIVWYLKIRGQIVMRRTCSHTNYLSHCRSIVLHIKLSSIRFLEARRESA